MCSIEDGAISQVISAIDQLAEDAETGLAAQELSTRVAAIWAMLADLDPEVARLRAAYEHPRRASSPARNHTPKGANGRAPTRPKAPMGAQ